MIGPSRAPSTSPGSSRPFPTVPETPQQDPKAIWSSVREELRSTLPPSAYQHWLEPLHAVGAQGGRLFVAGPERAREWFRRRYASAANEALRRRAPGFTEITLTDSGDPLAAASTAPAGLGASGPAGIPRGLEDLDFDRFVIGSGNRFAHSASLSVAESPGESYNPLFLYGAPGLGKTHLLVSIANYLRRQRPDMDVVYTTAERFTSEFVTSIRGKGSAAFKERYRGVGCLLIDDVQFLEGKERTEDEFFHTFNELYSQGSQIVLSSDRPPEAMERLTERLRDRFAWGLTVELQDPDLSTRIALLRRLAVENAIPTPDVEVLRQIAQAAPENLRRLEGALTRVTAFASMIGERPSAELVRRALGLDGTEAPAPVSTAGQASPEEQLERIQLVVCEVLHLAPADMRSKRRTPNAVRGRQLAMYVARNQTDLSLAQIARGFDRDHSTVLSSIRRVEKDMQPGGDVHRALERIHGRLRIDPAGA